MALIVVIWAMAFLGVVLSTFAFSMRTEVDAARNFTEEAEAAALAEAGLAKAAAELLRDRPQPEASAAAAARYDSGDVSLGRGTYRVVVTEEDAKISINSASAEVLTRLFRNSGVTDFDLLRTIVASILDWRDADDERRFRGAEREYYRSLPQPYYPRNADFPYLDELLLVKGMRREILDGNIRDAERLAALLSTSPENRVFWPGEYLGVRRFLTVRNSGPLNIKTASPDVLVANGVSQAEAQSGRQAQEEGRTLAQTRAAARQIRATAPFRSATGPLTATYLINSVGSLGGTRVVVQVLASVTGTHLRVVSWTEGS